MTRWHFSSHANSRISRIVNGPDFPGGRSVESCGARRCLQSGAIVGFGFRLWDIADRREEAAVVDSVDPSGGSRTRRPPATAKAALMDHLGL